MLKYFLPLALALSSLTHASCFYFGGSAGISALEAKKNHQIFNDTDTKLKSEHHDLGKFGFVGGGFVGYNFSLPQCFAFGIEVFGNGYTTKPKSTHDLSSSVSVSSILKISQRYNFGARVLPGYRFSKKIEGHVILGYTRGGFQLQDNGVYGIVSKKFNTNGFQIGVGTLVKLSKHVGFRLDSIYSGYPEHLNAKGDAPSVAQGGPSGGTTTKYQIKTASMDSTLSLVFSY